MNDNLTLIITIAAVAVVFGFMWHRGHLLRLRNYVLETREELRKCTWPSVNELKGSTVVVMITIALLGVFTVVIDRVIFAIILALTAG